MVRVPIACTLTTQDAGERIEQWRRLLYGSIDHAVRVGDERLRLRLNSSTEGLLATIDLAQREKACCTFFEFSIELEKDARWLVVSVPPEAVGVLDAFAELVPGTAGHAARPTV